MLAALKGMEGFVPASPTSSRPRRTRRRQGTGTHTPISPALSPTTENMPLFNESATFINDMSADDSNTFAHDSEVSMTEPFTEADDQGEKTVRLE